MKNEKMKEIEENIHVSVGMSYGLQTFENQLPMQHYGILYTGKAHLHLERSHREIKGK
jgi:hypothetical protein